jgi:hypothetical protein
MTGFVNILSTMAVDVNSAKADFLGLTTNYKDNPLAATEMKKINYFAGSLSPEIDLAEFLENIYISAILESQEIGSLPELLQNYFAGALRPMSDQKTGNAEVGKKVNQAHAQPREKAGHKGSEKKSDKSNPLNLYRLARFGYEKELVKINDIFTAKIKGLQGKIKEPLILESKAGTEMVISISGNPFSAKK